MSFVPLFNDNCNSMHPSHIIDRHFGAGLNLNNYMAPVTQRSTIIRPSASYYRPWLSVNAANDCGSTIKADKDEYHVKLNVQQFEPDEITVKVTGKNTITIEGTHEEKTDERGFISHHFVRRFMLPEGYDINNVIPSLSSDGILTIKAPSTALEENEHGVTPIQQTGVSSELIQKETKNKAS